MTQTLNSYIDSPEIKDIRAKRTLIAEITDAAEKDNNFPRPIYAATITENLLENVGVGAELLADRLK